MKRSNRDLRYAFNCLVRPFLDVYPRGFLIWSNGSTGFCVRFASIDRVHPVCSALQPSVCSALQLLGATLANPSVRPDGFWYDVDSIGADSIFWEGHTQ